MRCGNSRGLCALRIPTGAAFHHQFIPCYGSSEISFINPLTRPVLLSHQNQRMAHTPYHALNKYERQAYNARRQLLGLMGDLLRQAAIRMETCRMEKERSQGVLSETRWSLLEIHNALSILLCWFQVLCIHSKCDWKSQVANMCVFVGCLRCQSLREVCVYWSRVDTESPELSWTESAEVLHYSKPKCFSAVDMSDTSNPCLFVVLFQKASLQILLPVRPIGGCAAYGL